MEKPTSPVASKIDAIEKALAQTKRHKIRYDKSEGYFISSKLQSQIESMIDEAMLQGDESPTRLIELQEEVDQLRKDKATADAILKHYEEEVKQMNNKYHEFQESAVAAKEAWGKTQAEAKAEIAALRSKMAESQEALKAAKEAQQQSAKGFDPEEAVAWQHRVKVLQDKVNELNNRISEHKHELAVAHKEIDSASKKAAEAREKLTAESKKLSAMKSQKALAMDDLPPPGPVKVTIDNTWLAMALGEKGKKWLEKSLEASAIDVRERIYTLMLAAKSSQTKSIRSIADVLQIALDWVKRATYAARLKLKPWVDMITKDLASGVIKSARFYREELERLVTELKQHAVVAREKVSNKYQYAKERKFFLAGFFREVVAWKRVLVSRAKRYTKAAFKATKTGVSAVISTAVFPFRWLYAVVRPKALDSDVEEAHENIVLFDAEKETAPT
jgi:predicted  nucleic acid-binding Zn-ribbon protein